MVNYYKILDLENYASVSEVKAAYKAKIKRYHPDINSDPDAGEMTKYLNQAKEELASVDKKEAYDQNLKLAYLFEIRRLASKPKHSYWPIKSTQEIKKEQEDARKLRIKYKYESGLAKFPLILRIIGLVVLTFWGLQLMYTHQYGMYNVWNAIYLVLAWSAFTCAMAASANETYTYYLVKSVSVPIKYNFERIIAWFFVLSFLVGPSAVYGLNSFRKSYHLANNSQYTIAYIDYSASTLDDVIVDFDVDGKRFKKKLDLNLNELILIGRSRTVIKYATVDPLLCEAVPKEDIDALPNNF